MLRKLNLGCGFDKREGFINADNFPECEPDVHCDMEQFPWPFPDNQFDYILIKHALEHVGADFSTFKNIMKEIYRITNGGGIVEIHVPHYMHYSYWSDPTHVRAFTDYTFRMMSKEQNDEWIRNKVNVSMLAYMMDIDFKMESALQLYDPEWVAKMNSGEVSLGEVRSFSRERWNVVREIQIKLRAVKP